MGLFRQSFLHSQQIFFYYVFNDRKAWILSRCKLAIAGLRSVKPCCFTPVVGGLGHSGRAPRCSRVFLPGTSFPIPGDKCVLPEQITTKCFLTSHQNASGTGIDKNSKLSLFLQTQNPNQPLSLAKPKGWCSRRQSAAEPSEAAPRAGASVGAGCHPCPRCAAGTCGTGGSLIARGCCHVGDSGFGTGAPPETRKNRACPSWCSSSPPPQ